jgi:hypothetical protein
MLTKDRNQPHRGDGHLWCPTASPVVQICGRAGCRAMRQCINGVWTEPTTSQSRPTTLRAAPADLWASG